MSLISDFLEGAKDNIVPAVVVGILSPAVGELGHSDGEEEHVDLQCGDQ